MKYKSLLLFWTIITAGTLQAQDSSDQDEMDQFLQLLQEQTTLATQTRLNADFVPGMFTVLSAEQLQQRGFRNVWEALASVPGVRAVMNETGMRSLSVRGVGTTFEPSKIKLLLNGKALNASASATTGTLYDTPVTQVERIEFIRGPGSAIHGEFAYAGVLNVITRSRGAQISAGIESSDGAEFSALYTIDSADGKYKTSFNLAANVTDGEDIDSGLDRSPAGIATYAPGPINNKRDFFSSIIEFEAPNTRALLQFQQGNRGDYFGTNNLLPPDKRQTVISDEILSADISQSFDIDDTLTAGWSLNLLRNSTEQNELFLGTAQAFGGFGGEDDIVADTLLEEERLEARLHADYGSGRHQWLAELIFSDIEVTESEQFINLDPVTNLPTTGLNEFPGAVDESADRSAVSLVLQDEYRYDERLTLTAGVRYDDYEDIDANVSPRIALVWRRSEQHIYKAQFSRAFRPPSLVETGGSLEVEIDSETNDSLEFGHIYSNADLILRNTIYYSHLDDLIVFQDFAPFGYFNAGSSDLYGYELEVEKKFGNRWDIVSSLSLQEYADDELPGSAPWMLKLGTAYQVRPLTVLHLQLNSIAERARAPGDPRSDFEETTQLDATLRTQNFLDVDGLSLRLGIVNILDDELKHPAPADTYADDYPYSDGALLWAQIIYQP